MHGFLLSFSLLTPSFPTSQLPNQLIGSYSLLPVCRGLHRMTWSDVASDRDSDRSMQITDASVILAAGMAAEDLALANAEQHGAPAPAALTMPSVSAGAGPAPIPPAVAAPIAEPGLPSANATKESQAGEDGIGSGPPVSMEQQKKEANDLFDKASPEDHISMTKALAGLSNLGIDKPTCRAFFTLWMAMDEVKKGMTFTYIKFSLHDPAEIEQWMRSQLVEAGVTDRVAATGMPQPTA
jgi:hypothetical protein